MAMADTITSPLQPYCLKSEEPEEPRTWKRVWQRLPSWQTMAMQAAFWFTLTLIQNYFILRHYHGSTALSEANTANPFVSPLVVRETARPLKVLDKPLVILVSSDGFRWGYQHKAPTPNIDRLRVNGTEAETGMIPVYPTLTFPNHYSIVTGLYPAWHGVIANYFSDPNPNSSEKFNMGNHNPKWWLGEPIWETAVKGGLNAATYFWPGSEVLKGPWKCPQPFCPYFNSSVPFEERVDGVLGYLDLPPAERPSLITLYFEEPDEEGHIYGPDAPQITEQVVRVDRMIGKLLDGLEKRGIAEDVTIMMVGDHGMVGTCPDKVIYLGDLGEWIHIPSEWVDSYSPVLSIRPPPGVDVLSVYRNITEGLASGKVENAEFLKVYLKEDLPTRLHYSASERIQPIIGLVAEGYKVAAKRNGVIHCGGAHGYDNAYLSMRTIFFGHGPQFAKGRKVPSFENIQLYHVMTSILGVPAAPNNGTPSFAESILLPPA
jgi:ectonucleotide pyrophosphatase/phosphodiesterase family protein 1/3